MYQISCKVRTLRDGSRASYEVVKTCPNNLPYDPQPFPRGTWIITGLDWQKDKKFDPNTYGPVKIRTDAHQTINVWKLDEEGDYLEETEQTDEDYCYWLHFSISGTTLGCIRLASADDAMEIAELIQWYLDDRVIVQLEVI